MGRLAALAAGLGVAAALVALGGCGGSGAAVIPRDLPPAPATWPRPPVLAAGSCWARPSPGGGSAVTRSAPSYRPARSAPVAPSLIVARLLARFGDSRYVHRITLGPAPRITLEHLRGYYAGARPPRDALWAHIAAPGTSMVTDWESGLVEGALRDDFCAAGGPPLVGWTVSGTRGVSDHGMAFLQRFPNPAPAAFRARVEAVGRRFGFRVESLRLLRPLQLAPLLVVKTDRPRKAFAADVPAIMSLLDPIRSGHGENAVTFEGFLFEADDSGGPFVRVANVYRGEIEGSEWAWNPCDLPYAHSTPFGAKPCP